MRVLAVIVALLPLTLGCGVSSLASPPPPEPTYQMPLTSTPTPVSQWDNNYLRTPTAITSSPSASAPTPNVTNTAEPVSTRSSAQSITVRFTDVGSAVLTATGDKTLVVVNAAGFGPNTSHGIMIRRGTCDRGEAQDFGDVQFDLPTLQANAAGIATTSAALDIPLDQLADGNHKITVGMFAGRSRGADCGDIPGAAPAG